jgi:ATP-dependent helicase/nuclease subunit B
MIGIVYGKNGTGKSEWIFDQMDKAAETRRVFLLVPDREAVMAESRAAGLSNAGNIDVLTFGRLCNYLFRTYGGLCVDYIGKGAKKLIMRNVMRAIAPLLKEYGNAAESLGIYEKMTALRTVFYQDKIFPRDLDKTSSALGLETPLGSKISDLALIFSAFDAEVASRWEDPDGMLSRAERILCANDFFAGSVVFVDSFTSFSAQQMDILAHVMRGADDVFITLPYLPEERYEASVRFLAGTDDRLRRTAERAGVEKAESIVLRGASRYVSAELAFLSTEISAQASVREPWAHEPKDVHLVRAANVFAEAEAAALDICRAIRGGLRYRDIAVVVRDPASYEGILDAVFRKYEIPYFLSSRKEISEKPFVKFIFSAFSVTERGFRGEDVISYIKTGFSGITANDVSLLENYIIKWNLRGKLFTGDDPWNMHPRGYGFSFSDEDYGVLTRLAEMKKTVIEPLKTFSAANKTAKTVRERATLLFDFLSGLSIAEKLTERAEEAKSRGDLALAMETVQLWNAFCETLDQLVIASGDTDATGQEFSQMLMMLFLETDIGKIPTSVDEVVISGAAQTLTGGHKYVYIIGAAEGVFPQKVSEDGLFSEHEKTALAMHGVELSDRLERRVSEELYFFYRAAVKPSERLYVSFSHYSLSGAEQRESVGIKRIRKLFPKLSVRDFELSAPIDLVESRAASFEHATAFSGNLGRALREYYENHGEYAEKFKYMQMPLGAEKTTLSPENAALLFPGRLSTSYTRLEKFIKCRFAYFCEYELKLRDDSPASFGAVDIGSFMHGVLEKTVRWIAEGGEGDISEGVKRIAGEYLTELFRRDAEDLPKRLKHLFAYLCKSAEIFARRMKEEFDASSFRPCDFELTVGRDGNAVVPMRLAGEDVSVELRGKIDRVDILEGEGGRLYVRVVDYKTGEKTFDIKNVRLGLDMQMLLYLFSIWENGEKRYHGEIVPAGVLYAGIKPPQVDLSVGENGNEDDISVKTSGLFLKDEDVLRAMDPDLEGKWIPVKASDLGKDKPNLVGLDAFLALKEEVTETVLKYASELKAGNAQARPMTAGGTSPCEYCRMRAVCRIR